MVFKKHQNDCSSICIGMNLSKCGMNGSSMMTAAHDLVACLGTNCQFAQLTLCHQLMLISGSRGRQLFGQLASAIGHCPLKWCYNDEQAPRDVHCRIIFSSLLFSCQLVSVWVGWVGVLAVCRTANSSSPKYWPPLATWNNRADNGKVLGNDSH